MPDTIAALQAQLDDLKRAYRQGARSISYEGKQISYRSAEEMRAAISSLDVELGIQSTVRSVNIRSTKGW
jgi:hypothetical protein